MHVRKRLRTSRAINRLPVLTALLTMIAVAIAVSRGFVFPTLRCVWCSQAVLHVRSIQCLVLTLPRLPCCFLVLWLFSFSTAGALVSFLTTFHCPVSLHSSFSLGSLAVPYAPERADTSIVSIRFAAAGNVFTKNWRKTNQNEEIVFNAAEVAIVVMLGKLSLFLTTPIYLLGCTLCRLAT